MDLRASLEEDLTGYTTTGFVKLSPEDPVTKAAKLMKESSVTEAVVVSEGSPIGIVTERDILYKVVAAGLDPGRTRVREVMSAPVETIEETAKVKEAMARMSSLGVRRLMVTKGGKVVGLVSQKVLVEGGVKGHVVLPELAVPGVARCPYCDATMKDRKELSKHIDQVHLGLGLLEGNRSRW